MISDRDDAAFKLATTTEHVKRILTQENPAMSEDMLRIVMAAAQTAARTSLDYLEAARLDRIRAVNESLTDGMTGLHNKRGFIDGLERTIGQVQANKSPFSLVFMYFDNLKHINDTQGHRAGDKAIIDVANILRWYTQPTNSHLPVSRPARFEGGDDFGVALTQATQRDAADWWQALDATFRASDIVMCTGIVTYDTYSTLTPEDLCGTANDALLAARQQGGVVFARY